MFFCPRKFDFETCLWTSLTSAPSDKVISAKVLFMIMTFEMSPEFRYFSNVVMLIFLTELKLLEFPK